MQSFRRAFSLAMSFLVSFGACGQVALADGEPTPLNLNLGSNARTVAAPAGIAPTNVQNANYNRTITAGSMITAAEFVALQQVLAGGPQTIKIGQSGQAVGGNFATSALTGQSIGALAIPHAVTAVLDAGVNQNFSITGNLTNAGNILALSSVSSVMTALLGATNIYNQKGGSISSVFPAGGLAGYTSAVANLDLSLLAVHDIINSGAITSSGNLNLTAGGSIVNSAAGATGTAGAIMQALGSVNLNTANLINTGAITATTGNLNIASAMAQSASQAINIDSTGGVMSALAGAINIRECGFIGDGDTTLAGGDWLSRELNIRAGSGDVIGMLGKVTGALSVSGYYAHLGAATPTLVLGNMKLDGDPLFINSTGDILIAGDIQVSEALAIVASGSISADGPGSNINLWTNMDGNGRPLTIVAGANIVGGDNSGPVAITPSTLSIDILGPSGTGGDVNFNTDTVSIETWEGGSDVGGDVQIVAYRGTLLGAGGGHINMSQASIDASAPANTAGSVTILGGAGDGTITVGSIAAFDMTSLPVTPNSVTIATSQPSFSSGTVMTIGSDGSITSGNRFVASSQIASAGVSVGSIVTSANIDITAGGDVQASSVIGTDGDGTNISIRSVGGSLLLNALDSTNGSINLRSFASITNASFVFLGADNGSVNLTSDNGDIGGAGFLNLDVPRGSFNAPNGTVRVANNQGIILDASSAGQDPGDLFVLQTGDFGIASDIRLAGNVTGRKVQLSVDSFNSVPSSVIADPTVNVSSITVGSNNFGVALSPNGTTLYQTDGPANLIRVIDTATNTVTGLIPTGTTPTSVAVDPQGKFVYVTNQTSNTVSVIDAATHVVVNIITVGGAPTDVVVNPQGTQAYVTAAGNNEVAIIDLRTNVVIGTVPVSGSPSYLAVNPSGTRVYVSDGGGGNVAVIDPRDQSIVTTVAFNGPGAIGVNPDGRTAYVVSDSTNVIGILDLATNTITGSIPLPAGAVSRGVSFNPAGTLAYLALAGSTNEVTTVDTGSNTVVQSIPIAGSLVSGLTTGYAGGNFRIFSSLGAGLQTNTVANVSASESLNVTSQNTTRLNIAGNLPTGQFPVSASLNLSSRDALTLTGPESQAMTIGSLGNVTFTGDTALGGGPLSVRALGSNANITFDGGTLLMSGPAILTASGMVQYLNGHDTDVASLDVLSPHVRVSGASQLSTSIGGIAFTTPIGSTLLVDGTGGSMTASDISFIATAPAVIFSLGTGTLSLTGDVTIEACPGFVQVANGTTVNYANNLTIETCSVINPNGFVGLTAPVINICPDCNGPLNAGGGTIVNAGGDVILQKGTVINSNGLDVAVIASGNVSASGINLIDLSSKTSNGGNLFIAAGVEISPLTAGQIKDSTNAYTIYGPSLTGGSVLLSGVDLNTSSKAATATTGGQVTVVAYEGTQSTGTIELKSVNTSSLNGTGGQTRILGEGGVTIKGNVTTTGGVDGGNMGIGAEAGDILAPLVVINGVVVNPLDLQPGCPACGSPAAVSVGGTINTSGFTGFGGQVILEAPRLVNVGGSIITGGQAGCCASGFVMVMTDGGAFKVGKDLNLNGIDIKSAVSAAPAGDAGNLDVFGTAFVEIGGNLLARGGSTKGTGNAGEGGAVSVLGGPTAGPNGYNVGSFVVKGYVDLTGGDSVGGQGGNGGLYIVQTGRMAVLSSKSGASINTTPGTGVTPGSLGFVSIDTFGVQPLPVAFDLTSTKKTEFALPGGMFTVGDTSKVNGTSGNIVTGADTANKTNAGRLVDGMPLNLTTIDIIVTGGPVTITENGAPKIIAPDNGAGVRTMVPAGEALALFQGSRDSTPGTQTVGLNALGQVVDASPNGGGFSRFNTDYFELNSLTPFSTFNLATTQTNKISMFVQGDGAYLNLASANKSNFFGTVDFTDFGANGFVDLGAKPLNIGPAGIITSSNSEGRLTLVGRGSTWTNNGRILAEFITFDHSSSDLKFIMGAGGILGSLGQPAAVTLLLPSLKLTGGQLREISDMSLRATGKAGAVSISTLLNNAVLGNVNTFKQIDIVTSGSALRVRDGATVQATGTVKLSNTGVFGLFVGDGSTVRAGKGLTILDNAGGIGLGNNGQLLTDSGVLTVQTLGRIEINNSALVRAGILKSTAPVVGVLNKNDIQSAGSITMSVGDVFDFDASGGNVATINSVGGNMTLLSGQNFDFDTDVLLKADGGNVFVRGNTGIEADTNFSVIARAVGTTGGGLQLAAGFGATNQIAQGFLMPSGTAPVPTDLGSNVTINNGFGTLGVVLAQPSLGGTIDLSNSGSVPAVLNVNRGVMIFQSSGADISINGGTFTTSALRPIAYYSNGAPQASSWRTLLSAATAGKAHVFGRGDDVFVCAMQDLTIDTAEAAIDLRQGALVSLVTSGGITRVAACSGPGHVQVRVGAHAIALTPGHELIVAADRLTAADLQPADGVGRRRVEQIGSDGKVALADFSIVSLLTAADHLQAVRRPSSSIERHLNSRLLKTAAALHHSTGGRGAFASKSKTEERPANEHLSPVGWQH